MNLWLLGGKDRQKSGLNIWIDMNILLWVHVKMDSQQGHTIEYRKVYSILCGSPSGKGIWGRMDTCICIAKSFCCPPETITTGYILQCQVKIYGKIFSRKQCSFKKKKLSENEN